MSQELDDTLFSQDLDEMIEELRQQGKLDISEDEEENFSTELTEEDFNEWIFGDDYKK